MNDVERVNRHPFRVAAPPDGTTQEAPRQCGGFLMVRRHQYRFREPRLMSSRVVATHCEAATPGPCAAFYGIDSVIAHL